MALDRQGYNQISKLEITSTGSIVHLEGFGSIKVLKIVAKDGDIGYCATNDLTMDQLQRLVLAEHSRAVEDYHWILKQTCNVERC